jgi:excisionase family DNA binding protein
LVNNIEQYRALVKVTDTFSRKCDWGNKPLEVPSMSSSKKSLSVSATARLCGVSRGTVGYWIRSRKLNAARLGRNYSIPAAELFSFLKSAGQKIPDDLTRMGVQEPCFRSVLDCWQFWRGIGEGQHCEGCIVLENQVDVCFTARGCKHTCCTRICHACRYYLEFYLPRIQFIHQVATPAAVYRDLCFWGGNASFAELCQLQGNELIGLGIERVFHADSLEALVANAKRRALGDPGVPKTYKAFLKNSRSGKLEVRIGDYPLSEPPGAGLLIAEAVESEPCSSLDHICEVHPGKEIGSRF